MIFYIFMAKSKIWRQRKAFELLFLTDEQEYTIDRYWERGGIFVLFTIYIVSTAIFIESPDVV